MKTLEQHTEEVGDWFDFEKVHKVMKFLNWKWADVGVPEIPVMRQHVRGHMKELYNRGKKYKKFDNYVSSGGFKVCYTKDVDENGPWDRFSVAFEAATWDTE